MIAKCQRYFTVDTCALKIVNLNTLRNNMFAHEKANKQLHESYIVLPTISQIIIANCKCYFTLATSALN